jgi:hypothetical protein
MWQSVPVWPRAGVSFMDTASPRSHIFTTTPSSSRGITQRFAPSENGFRRWHRRWARVGPTCSSTWKIPKSWSVAFCL